MERVWTQAVQRNLHDQLLGTATQRHTEAIRSASTPEASRFLDSPVAASDKLTDANFQRAVRRHVPARINMVEARRDECERPCV